MKISISELESIHLYQYPNKPWIFGDMEDIEFNNKTMDLYYHCCIDGSLELYRRVVDFDDLKQALYDGFPNHRINLYL